MRGLGRVYALNCAVSANRSEFAAGLIPLFLLQSGPLPNSRNQSGLVHGDSLRILGNSICFNTLACVLATGLGTTHSISNASAYVAAYACKQPEAGKRPAAYAAKAYKDGFGPSWALHSAGSAEKSIGAKAAAPKSRGARELR